MSFAWVQVRVEPVIDILLRGLCRKPYPGHPHGCPNWGKRPTCPPAAELFTNVFDLSRPVIAIVNYFALAAHVEKMKERHPGWSDRQLRNCLYWQAGARKELIRHVNDTLRAFARDGQHIATICPEAMGVNVTATLAAVGEDLEWPPVRIARQVALVGVQRHRGGGCA